MCFAKKKTISWWKMQENHLGNNCCVKMLIRYFISNKTQKIEKKSLRPSLFFCEGFLLIKNYKDSKWRVSESPTIINDKLIHLESSCWAAHFPRESFKAAVYTELERPFLIIWVTFVAPVAMNLYTFGLPPVFTTTKMLVYSTNGLCHTVHWSSSAGV